MLFQDVNLTVAIPESDAARPVQAINELQFGNNINRAVETGHRSDFALLLAMLSQDVRDTTPVTTIQEPDSSEAALRRQFSVPAARELRSNHDSYNRSASIAEHFHKDGMAGVQLQAGLCPDALAYLPEKTHDLAEDVYRNLSLHEQRAMTKSTPALMPDNDLYNQLIVAHRASQMQAYA
jgi:hypothetical protein